MILARHAEAMLWVGRYLERAETTARCLEFESNSIMHLRPSDARVEWEQLVRALGLEDELAAVGGLANRHEVADFLMSDTDNPGSVLSTVTTVRENLRAVRDRVPIELWEEANGLYLQLRALGPAGTMPHELHEVFLMVRRACLALSGVLNEAMRRDEGHAFIVIGRTLERSIFTVGLLRSGLTDPRGVLDATRLLRLTSSLQAYRRRHGHNLDPDVAVRYLLAGPDLPRSVLSCLARAEDCLTDLGSGAAALQRPRRRAGLLRARLELGDIEGELERGPVPVLTQLAAELAELAEEVRAGVVPPIAMPSVRSQYLRPGEAPGGGLP